MPWFDKHGKLRARLSAMVDGELSGRELTELSTHLDTCDDCTRELAELRALAVALQAVPEAEPRRSFALTPEMVAAPAKPAPPAPMPRLQVGMRLASAAIALALVVVFVADNGFGGDSSESNTANRDSGDDSASGGDTALESDAIVEELTTMDPAYSTIGETPANPQPGVNDGESVPATTSAPSVGEGSGEGGTGGSGSGGSAGGVGGGPAAGGGTVDGGGTVPEVTAVPPVAAPEATPIPTPAPTEPSARNDPTQTEDPLAVELASGDEDEAEDGSSEASPVSSEDDSGLDTVVVIELLLLTALVGTLSASMLLAMRRR